MALKLHVWLARPALDARLAAGEDPSVDPALGLRASRLVSARERRRVARGLTRVLAETHGPVISAAIPRDSGAIAASRPALEDLVAELVSDAPVLPRGVALAARLLTDPESELYRPADPEALPTAVREALIAMRTEGAR